ncbi:MAG: cyclic nucleotide-binding domain-containing protein, partial [Firmicutes bacterium]|nr:cyclic nucleotide-binding domain-containing protein [Bacillota bacterium]
MNRRILDKCALFKGLSGEELEKALSFLSARKKTYARGEALNRPGEALRSFGLVLEGCICVYIDDVSGDRLLMARVMPGVTFGESLCYLGMKT